ncbi:MAG: gamma-glutamylcyclotransferase family protein [Candidatus Hatepunaea meridiana]|nr:gamma-glutamylcyclotransferase family protein [Candidatus Hatepunaea meridiana]
MKSDKILYFAYGANLDMHGMELRCPGYIPVRRAVLHNYRLMFKSVADIEPAANHIVHGALYEITQEHLRSLDRFEGYPRLYTRKILPVLTDEDKEFQAIVYLMNNCRQYSSPHRGYLDIILSGCRQWQLPQEYIRYIITRANNPNFGEL